MYVANIRMVVSLVSRGNAVTRILLLAKAAFTALPSLDAKMGPSDGLLRRPMKLLSFKRCSFVPKSQEMWLLESVRVQPSAA